jgi:Domain of unknown function (DU1801)
MSKKENNLTLGISEPQIVDAFMQNLQHPLASVVAYIREVILKIDLAIGEGIYWNAPTFYYAGNMPPFEPKEYKRYIVGFVFNKQDCIRLIFLHAANVTDRTAILEGDHKDGRRLITFTSIADVKSKEEALVEIVKELLDRLGTM